jgi:hypothetical protein
VSPVVGSPDNVPVTFETASPAIQRLVTDIELMLRQVVKEEIATLGLATDRFLSPLSIRLRASLTTNDCAERLKSELGIETNIGQLKRLENGWLHPDTPKAARLIKGMSLVCKTSYEQYLFAIKLEWDKTRQKKKLRRKRANLGRQYTFGETAKP